MVTHGNLTLRDRDELDFPIGAFADYAAMLRLIGDITKAFDDDVAASIERIAWDIDKSVAQIRAFCDELQQRGAEKGQGHKRKVIPR